MPLKNKVGPIAAVAITVLLVIWMFPGEEGVISSPTESTTTPIENNAPSHTAESTLAYPVQARTLASQFIEMHLPLSGITVADESLQLTNNYQGRITKLPVEKGRFIKKANPFYKSIREH